jgi:hypothetical protein
MRRMIPPSGAADSKARENLKVKVMNVVQLDAGGKRYPPALVYFCQALQDKYACASSIADDTIHMTEFPESYKLISLPGRSKPRIVGIAPRNCDKFDLVAGDPTRLHASGYDAAIKLSATAIGEFTLPATNGSTRKILFLIVRRKGDVLYKKLVWVVSSRN